MSQSVTPLALDLDTFEPNLPSAVHLDSEATRSIRSREERSEQTVAITFDQYQQTLAALHKQRRDLLRLKRLGSPDYSEDEYTELRTYIDELQRVIVTFEENRHRAVLERVEALASELLSDIRG